MPIQDDELHKYGWIIWWTWNS